MTNRTYKWKPDIPDHRDHKFSLAAPAVLPQFVGPLGANNKVEDQGPIGSCTGHASTTALEISLNTSTQYSRLMAYYNGRLIENNVKRDDGAYIRDVIKGLKTYGVATEFYWPYDPVKFARKPTLTAYRNAKKVQPKISSYERLTTIDEIKVALASNLAVVFGFAVPEYFESLEVSENGWVRFPTPADKMIGGHAVAAIGYDERNLDGNGPFVWVRNSWSARWGLSGNFKMPYQWFTDPGRLVDDIWVMHPAV